MNKGVRSLKKLWCSVSGVVKYKDCFFQRFIEKIGQRGELRSWKFRALALVRANQRIMACEMFTIRGLGYCHTVFLVKCQFPCSAVHCVLAARGGGGGLRYFLGGYVPPGTPNWHPVLKKISPKIDTPF